MHNISPPEMAYQWDKVKCELRVASCELQKVTLYHNIYLQSFSTLKSAFKLHDLSYCTAPLDCLQMI